MWYAKIQPEFKSPNFFSIANEQCAVMSQADPVNATLFTYFPDQHDDVSFEYVVKNITAVMTVSAPKVEKHCEYPAADE